MNSVGPSRHTGEEVLGGLPNGARCRRGRMAEEARPGPWGTVEVDDDGVQINALLSSTMTDYYRISSVSASRDGCGGA